MPAADRLCVVESFPQPPPTPLETLHRLASIKFTEQTIFFGKTPLQLESYKISNNEMTCLLRIGNVTQYS